MVGKNVVRLLAVIIAVLSYSALLAQSNESLGDAARRLRSEKNNRAGQDNVPAPPSDQPPASSKQAASEAWEELVDRGEAAMTSGDYVMGEKLFRQSLAYAEQQKLGAERIGHSNEMTGWSMRAQRKYAEAEALYRSALQMFRGVFAENDESVARSKAGLGIALVGLGRYPEAESVLLESLNAYHEHPQASLCALSFPLDGLTMLYQSNHEYSKGERIYTEAFALMTGKRGTPCENFVSMLDHLAALYADDNQWDRVEQIQQGRAGLALGMKGPNSIEYANAVYAMAETLQKRRRFEESASTAAKAAEIYRHTKPPSKSKVGASLELQQLSLELAGRSEEAKQVHAAMLAALKSDQPKDERGEMMALRMRAIEARRNGDLKEDARLTAMEVAGSKNLAPSDQMIALLDSAMVHEEQQKLPEEEADLKKLLELTIATTGPSSHATAGAHFRLGGFYLTHHRLREAEESYNASLALLEPHDSEDVSMALAQLGYAYLQLQQFERAEAVYRRSIKLAEDTHNGSALSGALQFLAMVYQKTNRPADAEAALMRALDVSEKLPKPMNRQWVAAAMMTATFYEQSGRPQQAEQMYERVLTFLEQEVGANNPALRLPMERLISILKSQGRVSEAGKLEARRDKLPPMPTMPGMPAMAN